MDLETRQDERSVPRRFVFAMLGYGAGILGILAWGCIAGAIFLVLGGGIGGDTGTPVLPFMTTWASVFAGPGVLMVLLMRLGNRELSSTAPWTWMRLIVLSASLPCVLAWVWLWLV